MIREVTGSAVADEIAVLETALNCRTAAPDGRDGGALLSADFYEFGASGRVWSRATVLEALKDKPLSDVRMRDAKALLLADDTLLLTYRAEKAAGDSGSWLTSMRTSVWSRASGQWQMVFHQGTIAA